MVQGHIRDRPHGLNAGRWDYIFSAIKCFPDRPEMVLPDRTTVTIPVPFMRAYTECWFATCHRRAAHAIGGMAAPRVPPPPVAQALARVLLHRATRLADRVLRLALHLLAGPAGLGPRPARVRTGVALGTALDFLALPLKPCIRSPMRLSSGS